MQRYNNISENFTNFDLKSFIDRYFGYEITAITLRLSKEYGRNMPFLAEQLKIYPKAQEKLPSFTQNYCFFTSKSFEQASSEVLANYKASLFKAEICLDLCGGLGVDDWAFAKQFSKVVSLDKDVELNKLVRKNFELLHVHNIERIDADAYEYIKKDQTFDLIYLDADRRPDAMHKRVAALTDAEPDIINIKERLFELSNTILLKLSPMLDISAIIHELKDVKEIHAVSLLNEVKELIVVLQKGTNAPTVKAVNIDNMGLTQMFTARWNEPVYIKYNEEGTYFYEPGLSLIKSGNAVLYAAQQEMYMLSPNTYYFVSDKKIENFFGRGFKVVSKMVFTKSGVKKYLQENGLVKANVAKRNFPMEVAELKKLFSINDGGDDYLFFTQNKDKQKIMFHCRKT